MANIGLSDIFAADCKNDPYRVRRYLGGAISASLTLDNGDAETLRADNSDAERTSVFTGATLALDLADIYLPHAKFIFGYPFDQTDTQIVYAAEQQPPQLTLFLIVKKIVSGVIAWRVVTLYKVQFMLPDYSVDTQGETVSFQTHQLEAKVLRADNGEWCQWKDFSTYTQAVEHMRNFNPYASEQGGEEVIEEPVDDDGYIEVNTAGGNG